MVSEQAITQAQIDQAIALARTDLDAKLNSPKLDTQEILNFLDGCVDDELRVYAVPDLCHQVIAVLPNEVTLSFSVLIPYIIKSYQNRIKLGENEADGILRRFLTNYNIRLEA